MKTLFWNIGKKISDTKLQLIEEAITVEEPDIFCIAEGSKSKEDCQKIIDVFIKHSYYCYYSPLFYQRPELKLTYKYKANGLKVFVRDSKTPTEQFSFSHQRYDGRIIVLKTMIDFLRPTTFIFLHNKAKSGNREVTDPQRVFISELKILLRVLQETGSDEKNIEDLNIIQTKERFIIIGDFNLEPWDNPLRQQIYLNTTFFQNHNSIFQRRNGELKNYFNPVAEHIFKTPVENLGGTYFSDNNGWALFDFVLYDTKDSNISYNIITEFKDGSKLLNYDTSSQGAFLNNELDHLPILAKINN